MAVKVLSSILQDRVELQERELVRLETVRPPARGAAFFLFSNPRGSLDLVTHSPSHRGYVRERTDIDPDSVHFNECYTNSSLPNGPN
jgi:hypothetical protein